MYLSGGILFLAAFTAAAPAMAQQAASPPHVMGAAPAAGSADQAMKAGMDKMRQDMADAPMTGDADRDFVAMMIPHHQGAVEMAKVELLYGKNPEIRKLARAIVAAQNRELGQMQAWLAKHQAK